MNFIDGSGVFDGPLLEFKGLLPEWYKDKIEKFSQKCKLLAEETYVSEEEFNRSDDEEMEKLPF